MDTAELEFDNAFWRFSLAVYVAPGVAEECLALQETSNIDVNYCYFAPGWEQGAASFSHKVTWSARTLPFVTGARMSCIHCVACDRH